MSSTYGTIITNEGAAIIADCILNGKKLQITQAAAGDGGGAYYQPVVNQAGLQNEKWRGPIAGYEVSKTTKNMLDVKVVIGDDVGGFTVREMGLFNDDGIMIAVCNTPDTEKVAISAGVSGKLTMLMHIVVADASVIEFTLTPNLDTVSREEMDEAIAEHDGDKTAHPELLRLTAAAQAAADSALAAATAYRLKITFAKAFSGRSYSVKGGSEQHDGVVPSGLVVFVDVKKANTTYTVTTSDATGTSYSAKVTTAAHYGQYAVSVAQISAALNDNSWATIRAVSDAGMAANYWDVGDTKTVVIDGKVGVTTYSKLSVDVFILGFDHNERWEGAGKIHFQLGKINGTAAALCDANYNTSSTSAGHFQMNLANTNAGGWADSYMRKTLLGNDGTPAAPVENSLLAALPADLRAVMKPVGKYTDNAGQQSTAAENVTVTVDYLFLLAQFEVFGSLTNTNPTEQVYQEQYDYYKAGNSKVAYKDSDLEAAVWWWLRSPSSANSTNFRNVNTNGNTNNNNAYYSAGVRPGFCVCGVTWSSESERRPTQKERYFPGWKSLKLPFDALTRTLLAW